MQPPLGRLHASSMAGHAHININPCTPKHVHPNITSATTCVFQPNLNAIMLAAGPKLQNETTVHILVKGHGAQ